jgi:hypothetical protein
VGGRSCRRRLRPELAVAGAFNNHSKGLEEVKRLHGGRLHTSAHA